MATLTFPTKVGETGYFCADPTTANTMGYVSTFWNQYVFDTTKLGDANTGATYKAFCAGASALQVAGAMASMALVASSY